ncbi:hypothetical protein AtubIFM61612_004212 [Aspergillus tubingensis]|nr:hypothetical protein AtubIFM61612_004212 [Aspergillus tubingensis]
MPRASTALVPAVDLVLPVIEGSSERSNRPGRTYQFPNNAYNIHLHRESNWAQATGTYEEVMARARAGEELHIQPGEHDCVFQNSAPDRTDGDFEVAWVVLAFSLGGREFDVKAQMVAEGSEKQQFNARFNRIRHALATIKNKTLPRQAGVQIDLTPRKFRMATCTGTFLEQPILSLIFHVVDGQDSDSIPPIPAGHTASILIHQDILYRKILEPSILKGNNKDWKLEGLTGYEGGGVGFSRRVAKALRQVTFDIPCGRAVETALNTRQAHLEVTGWNEDLKICSSYYSYLD